MTNPITGDLLGVLKLLLADEIDESLDEHEVMEKAYKALDNYNPDKLEQVREVLKAALMLVNYQYLEINSERACKEMHLCDAVESLDHDIRFWALTKDI